MRNSLRDLYINKILNLPATYSSICIKMPTMNKSDYLRWIYFSIDSQVKQPPSFDLIKKILNRASFFYFKH